ncbi:MAG: hypothetical protein IJE97_13450 [Thermoguttaceae bacterium]|nr:hypothetical protein [Thermoguttaceae bacterium]
MWQRFLGIGVLTVVLLGGFTTASAQMSPSIPEKSTVQRMKPNPSADESWYCVGGPSVHFDIFMGGAAVLEFESYWRNVKLRPIILLLNRGRYEEAINAARLGVEYTKPWRTDVVMPMGSGARDYRDYMSLLATACELNGNWGEALNVYAALDGNRSANFQWALARIYHSLGLYDAAFTRIMSETPTLDEARIAMERLKEKVESGKIVKTEKKIALVAVFEGRATEVIDVDWMKFYRFRDNGARVVCPELHFATLERVKSEADEKYDALWNASFERFIAFLETMYAKLPENAAAVAPGDFFPATQESLKGKMAFWRELRAQNIN